MMYRTAPFSRSRHHSTLSVLETVRLRDTIWHSYNRILTHALLKRVISNYIEWAWAT